MTCGNKTLRLSVITLTQGARRKKQSAMEVSCEERDKIVHIAIHRWIQAKEIVTYTGKGKPKSRNQKRKHHCIDQICSAIIQLKNSYICLHQERMYCTIAACRINKALKEIKLVLTFTKGMGIRGNLLASICKMLSLKYVQKYTMSATTGYNKHNRHLLCKNYVMTCHL